ncbi:MAG: hypothetical protein ACPG8K_02190 [Crocinitomicaceae bacterium]
MKTFLATVAGIIVGVFTIWAMEAIGHLLFPLPAELTPTNLEELKQVVMIMPIKSLLVVIIAQIIGVFSGMYVGFIMQRESLTPLYIIAGLFIFSTVLNLILMPHPTWFMITDLSSILLVSLLFIRSVKKS